MLHLRPYHVSYRGIQTRLANPNVSYPRPLGASVEKEANKYFNLQNIKMKKGIYFVTLILVCCTGNKASKDINSQNINVTSNQINNDSLSDYRSFYYLSNISTTNFAELYLKDSIMTNDYKKLYDCLDSLSSANINTRNFYFKVLIKALDNLEVVFHQKMGVYLVKNIDKFTDEFLDRLSTMNNEEIKYYAQAIENYISGNVDQGEKWLQNLKLLEKESPSEKLDKLDLLFKEIELAKSETME
jgi:hypothetical protein